MMWYHGDSMSNTRLLTDPYGALTGSLSYDAFGNTNIQTGTADTNLKFCGLSGVSTFDGLIGQYYKPRIGRDIAFSNTDQVSPMLWFGLRWPDFGSGNVSVGPANASATVAKDNNNPYFGAGVDSSGWSLNFQGSASVGWVLKNKPSNDDINDFVGGVNISVFAYNGIGGCLSYSPSTGTFGVQIGVGTPQYGAQVSVSGEARSSGGKYPLPIPCNSPIARDSSGNIIQY